MLFYYAKLAAVGAISCYCSVLSADLAYGAETAALSSGSSSGASDARDQESREAAARYPTTEEVFYVLSCMEANSSDAAALQKCSCAVNVLEQKLPFDQYKDAELVMALRQAGGRNAGIFRDTSPMRDIVKVFTEAQKAANSQCFGEKAASRGNGAAGH